MGDARAKNFLNMSLAKLKDEYYKCDDKVAKMILRKIIKQKSEQQKIKKEKSDAIIDDLILLKSRSAEKHIVSEKQQVYQKRGPMEQHWESHKSNSTIDPKFKNELNSDLTNNKLMERLNIELDFRINGKKEKIIDKPYVDSDYGDYLSVRDFDRYAIPKNNFLPSGSKRPNL
jgi:hypothetical protein